MRPVLRRVGNLLLSLAALAGVLCLLVVLAGALFGIKPLVFRSGSMEPAISTGSLAFARETDGADLAVDDVISVERAGTWVTHRIVSIENGGQRDGEAVWLVRLKGDDNKTPDSVTDQVTSAPRVFWHVPGLGGVIGWLAQPPGVYVLALYLALCVGLVVGGKGAEEAAPGAGDEPRGSEESDHEATAAAEAAAAAAAKVTTGEASSPPGARRRDVRSHRAEDQARTGAAPEAPTPRAQPSGRHRA